ncbi:MAG TPA: hypothetical protein VN903_23045 [Polyangia bacterium]|nr:hypothetical protein [Polyangia bacterium]
MHATGLMAMGRKIVDYVFRPADQAGLANYNTAGPVTYLASDLMQRLILRDCNGAARSDVTPSAQQIIDALTVFGRAPVPGNSYEFIIRNSSAGAFAITIVAGAGVTLSPAAITIAQANARAFMVVINSPTAVTIYSLGSGTF